jgi:hypothetical protein
VGVHTSMPSAGVVQPGAAGQAPIATLKATERRPSASARSCSRRAVAVAAIATTTMQDRHGAKRVLSGISQRYPRLGLVWVDGGYVNSVDTSLVGWAATEGIEMVAVPRNADVRGFQVLPRRWVVERTFAWLTRCRRLARDYERKTAHSEAMIQVASIRLMLARLAGQDVEPRGPIETKRPGVSPRTAPSLMSRRPTVSDHRVTQHLLTREDESYEKVATIAALVGTPAMTLHWLERDLPMDVIARGLVAKLGPTAAAKAHAAGRL